MIDGDNNNFWSHKAGKRQGTSALRMWPRESDLSSSESEDEEEQERLDRQSERKRKSCRFLDDQAGLDDRWR